MPFAIFQNENVADGLAQNSAFQAGISDLDPTGTPPEQGVNLPFPGDAQGSYIFYECSMVCYLDSGLVVLRPLPQVDNQADTLGSYAVDAADPDKVEGGVNMQSQDQYEDVVQRMAHSRYWFNLIGRALRVGQQVPIPKLVKVAGADAVPEDGRPQMAYNRIVSNYSGQLVYLAEWSLWYTLATPPSATAAFVPPNLAAHAGEDDDDENGPQAPYSVPDDQAVNAAPVDLVNPLR